MIEFCPRLFQSCNDCSCLPIYLSDNSNKLLKPIFLFSLILYFCFQMVPLNIVFILAGCKKNGVWVAWTCWIDVMNAVSCSDEDVKLIFGVKFCTI